MQIYVRSRLRLPSENNAPEGDEDADDDVFTVPRYGESGASP
jgi:hypothetical protein